MQHRQINYSNIFEALFEHAKCCPDKLAFSYIEGRDVNNLTISSLSYSELFLKVCNLSVILQQEAKQGDRVLLCYPAGLDFIVAFYASLFAGLIAVPVVVPGNVGMVKKFLAITEDSNPRLVLTDQKTQPCIDDLQKIKSIATDTLNLTIEKNDTVAELRKINRDDVALLQYTSGSTSDPKGVMVTHGNLVDNISEMSKAYNIQNEVIGMMWLPHTHDMGLIGNLSQSGYLGGTTYMLSPMTFARNPILWLQCISHFRANTVSAPNFALTMCVEKITPALLRDLDLRCLTCLIVGAEMISTEILMQFATVFEQSGFDKNAFAPSYGLAEGTLMVSAGFGINTVHLDSRAFSNNSIHLADNASTARQIVSCGKPFQHIKIVKPNATEICNDNEIGEVLISGSSVTKGYWNKPSVTAAMFRCRLENDVYYFRTGDLGFLYQDELYIVGRIKDVIIINGLNYYPHDIEDCVKNADPILKNIPVVAFSYRANNNLAVTDTFVILINLPRSVDASDLESVLIKARMMIVKEFQLIPYDIQLVNFNFPKTTSGKIQRNLCRLMYENTCQQLESVH